MKNILFTGFICVLLVGTISAQKSKPWTEWSKKDADRMLNDSAWGQSQTLGEGPAIISKSASETRSTQANVPNESQTGVNFRIRFVTAKPIRQGFGRKLLLEQPNASRELQDQVRAFVDRDFGDLIVVGVNVDGQDPRVVSEALQSLVRLTTELLKGKAYLERKDGKRLPLIEYRPPTADNMGGKFIFARTMDGMPFLSAESGNVRFYSEVGSKYKLSVKYKLADMVYDGKLEY